MRPKFGRSYEKSYHSLNFTRTGPAKSLFLRGDLGSSSIILDWHQVQNSKFYMSVAKGVKLKVRKIWRLNPTFVEDIGEKLIGGHFCYPSPPPHPDSPMGTSSFI